MSLVISVYSREAYREFLLPSINNADHSMVLHRSFFGLKEDLSIRLEILDGIWSQENMPSLCAKAAAGRSGTRAPTVCMSTALL